MTALPTITFDTNIPASPETRAFWATLCEEIGQRMVMTPTASAELLSRVSLDGQREWTRRLRRINQEQGLGWDKVRIRRLATTGAVAARDWLLEEMGRQGAIYAKTPPPDPATEAREAEIDDCLPDSFFDLTTGNGVRDRNIVVEALAWGFDILATNNINSIDHVLLREWIEGSDGQRLRLTSTILRPQEAEGRLRKAYGKPVEWTAHALARACVSNPDDEDQAANEMLDMLSPFQERGMGELRMRIEGLMADRGAMRDILDAVRRHGNSLAMRSDVRVREASASAVAKKAGIAVAL